MPDRSRLRNMGTLSGKASPLLALSAGGLVGALAAPALENPWDPTVALGILALPAGVLAVLFGIATRIGKDAARGACICALRRLEPAQEELQPGEQQAKRAR